MSSETSIVDWAVQIVSLHAQHPLSDTSDLQLLAKLQRLGRDPYVEIDEYETESGLSKRYFLRSQEFVSIQDRTIVQNRGQAIIGIISAVMQIQFETMPMTQGAIAAIYGDGSRKLTIDAVVAMQGRGTLSAEISPTGDDKTIVEKAIEFADQNPRAVELFARLADSPTWIELYKDYELLLDLLGKSGAAWERIGASSKHQLDRFTLTAQFHRHAGKQLPSNPMTLEEARDFVYCRVKLLLDGIPHVPRTHS